PGFAQHRLSWYWRLAKYRREPTVLYLLEIVLALSLLPELELEALPTSRPALAACKKIESLSNLPPTSYFSPRARSAVLSNHSYQTPEVGLFEPAFGCTRAAENGSCGIWIGRLVGCFLLLFLQVALMSLLQIAVNIRPKLFQLIRSEERRVGKECR